MTKRMLIGMLVCSAFFLGVVQARGEDVGPGRWWRSPDMARDINLTDKEKQILDDMFAKNRDALIDMKSDLEKERLKLEDILDKDPVDQSAAKAQFKRIEAKRQRLSAERFNYILEVRKLLGSERFRTLSGKFRERMMHGPDRMMQRPDRRGPGFRNDEGRQK
ncbi:MAG TPA: periplasmic heavy metal sensor [Desulfomonilia bacterium]|nr:periplasmic heavy metal sensor [Desulfomonilia bacterium]